MAPANAGAIVTSGRRGRHRPRHRALLQPGHHRDRLATDDLLDAIAANAPDDGTIDVDAAVEYTRHIRVLFDADDAGYAVLLVDGDVPEAMEADAQLCVDNCPEFAMALTQSP
jgi:hypothetical protein